MQLSLTFPHLLFTGQPPATGTCTVVVYLSDLNDNAPYLVSKNAVMCRNKVNHVDVKPMDIDGPLYASPFSFFLGGKEELKNLWKLDPSTGQVTYISFTSFTVNG